MKTYLISLIIPVNLCIFLIGIALIFFLFKRKKLAILTGLLGVTWLFLWSLPITSYYFGSYLERYYPYIPPEQHSTAQAIIVFGGNTANNRQNWFSPYSEQTKHSRIDTADDLFFLHKAPLIIVSGAALEGKVSEAHSMANQLHRRGIPKEAILIENQSTTTRENALYVTKLLAEKNISQVFLVTSALHMPRSMAAMKKLGYTPIAASNPPQITFPQGVNPYLPNKRALEASRSIIKEYIGLLTYFLRDWI